MGSSEGSEKEHEPAKFEKNDERVRKIRTKMMSKLMKNQKAQLLNINTNLEVINNVTLKQGLTDEIEQREQNPEAIGRLGRSSGSIIKSSVILSCRGQYHYDGGVDDIVDESADVVIDTVDEDIVEVVASYSVGLQETEKDATNAKSKEDSQPSEDANDGKNNDEDVALYIAAVSDISALPDCPSAPDDDGEVDDIVDDPNDVIIDYKVDEVVTSSSVRLQEVEKDVTIAKSPKAFQPSEDANDCEPVVSDEAKVENKDTMSEILPLPEGWIQAADP